MKNNLKQQLSIVEAECRRLEQENRQLKNILNQYNISFESKQKQYSRYSEEINRRIHLFKSLFKGRNDVYAIRWTSENGKAGYSPATEINTDGGNSNYLPLTDHSLYDHLTGKQVMGIYPLLLDNTCWFLALDFDKEGWEKESKALLLVCQIYHIPAAMERSRSGNGCHIWIFFSEQIPASTARQLGSFLIKETLKHNQWSRLIAFDRMFPAQDTRKTKGLGNLIALPLQKQARNKENSVFVDQDFNMIDDQWKYMQNLQKLNLKNIHGILSLEETVSPSAETVKQEVKPQRIHLTLKNGIYISKRELQSTLLDEITKLASFSNPNYYKAKAQRRSTHQIPSVIDCSEQGAEYVIIPRGCLNPLKELLQAQSIEWTIQDESYQGKSVSFVFQGELTFQQEEALSSLLKTPNGIIAATMGFGKTVVAASLIAQRNVNTLIIVNSKQLLEQWKEKLLTFLNIEEQRIGQIGGGKYKPSYIVDIATMQTLNRNGKVKDSVTEYGQVIVDECHHISAFSFEAVLKKVRARYVHGLTATPSRKDGLQPIMNMQCGPIIYKLSAKKQAKIRPFQHILIPRYTMFKSSLKENEKSLTTLGTELVNHQERNELIFNDVLAALDKGATPMILTERIEHIKLLKALFKGFVKNIIVLNGNLSSQEKQKQLDRLNNMADKEYLIIATGKYIGEGFDHDKLDCLFLVYPISWGGTLQQYVGRIHRMHQNKTKVQVYDYIDHQEPLLQSSYEKRFRGYNSLGYKIQGERVNSTEQMEMF
ncbi:DEAD/DEAH box helicase [Gracilibacillus alcaliphilus]|uniref:DEAD/DEAH box helicase n=1 Tax=Gracilibacillus alcaliphilus TaxID=1401441 RepID=UPI00195E0743|nr:DEAD/DEAH box helicase [Gracilibacillus alcaliphilus]MBM7677611.1 superfamily II DNA or RNA helicase [Gracilibacillus alcaliphilus]